MSVPKEILKILAKGLGVAEFASQPRYLPYEMIWKDLGKQYNPEAVRIAIKRVVEKGLVKKKRINQEQVYLALTKLGEEHLKKISLKPLLKIKPPKEKWDGKYRFIIFDIPEEKRIIRDLLRSKLKEFGCVGWQKSVWVTKENISKIMLKFIEENKLKDYILVLETDTTNNEKLERLVSLVGKTGLPGN